MYELRIKGFRTKQQVEAFVEWYEGQGEQDASIWFANLVDDGELDVDFMPCDCGETYPVKFNGNVATMALKIAEGK